MKNLLNILFAGLILFTLSIAGQTQTINGSTQISTGKGFYTFVYSAEKVVKDASYSAAATTEIVRVLGDGNKITRSTKTMLYRDGEGRTRRDEILKPNGAFSNGAAETITIFDPIAGYRYYLNPTAKIARRAAIPSQKTGVALSLPPPNVPPPLSTFNFTASAADGIFTVINPTNSDGFLTKTEDLRPRVIEGVEATGKSSMTTILAGTIGNERDIVTTSETWYSKDLQMTILSKRNDPQTGNYTYQLTNIERSEPDKSLFTVPADYKIVDSPSAFNGKTVFSYPKTN